MTRIADNYAAINAAMNGQKAGERPFDDQTIGLLFERVEAQMMDIGAEVIHWDLTDDLLLPQSR